MACDTEYTWRPTPAQGHTGTSDQHDHDPPGPVVKAPPRVQHLTRAQMWRALVQLDPAATTPGIAPVDLVVVTGGEPMMRQDVIHDLALRAAATGRSVEIETNATIAPGPALLTAGVWFNASPKLANSAVPERKRIKAEAITALQRSGRTRWKFVVTSPDDLQEIDQLQRQFGLSEVWLSPEGTNAQAIAQRMPWMAQAALARGWHLTTREHVLIWGNEHGR
ncbi:hypothetical protein LWF15_35120 [Kineosporia rhizophila]|uniref:hypothetical protein n=1 Tax=Kineosporia rhizophila TaxID=84633 RepID=UPI001E542E6E|nr:hypothetical protein [Kineosporia rhizophila]MCE0540738.1 hypothetical protein [Kineosporia rhizophila]